MLQQAFAAMLESRGRAGAARAGAVHREVDNPVAESAIEDVAAVARHGGAYAGLDQFLDLLDHLGVGWIVIDRLIIGRDGDATCAAAGEQGRLADEMVQQNGDNLRLERGPLRAGRGGDRDEVAAEEDAGYLAGIEQSL